MSRWAWDIARIGYQLWLRELISWEEYLEGLKKLGFVE